MRLTAKKFRHFGLYGGRGLALWLYEKRLMSAYADEPLAEYAVGYNPDRRRDPAERS